MSLLKDVIMFLKANIETGSLIQIKHTLRKGNKKREQEKKTEDFPFPLLVAQLLKNTR